MLFSLPSSLPSLSNHAKTRPLLQQPEGAGCIAWTSDEIRKQAPWKYGLLRTETYLRPQGCRLLSFECSRSPGKMVFDFPKERFALLLAGRTVSMLLAEIAMAPSASASGPSDIHSQAEVVVCMLFTGEVEERRLARIRSQARQILLGT